MTITARSLLRRSRKELDKLFSESPLGAIPEDEGAGTMIVCPGGFVAGFLAWVTRWFRWQGMVFSPTEKCAHNFVTPFGIKAFKANVYEGESRFDGRPCIAIDYSNTSFLAKHIRGELRLVAPNLYLGQAYWGERATPLAKFAISYQFQPARKTWRRIWSTAAIVALVFLCYMAVRLGSDETHEYADLEDHFKFGSTGGERESGFPYWMWKAFPTLFPEFLPYPEEGLASFGFIMDPNRPHDADLPVGVSKRKVQGIDRVFLNCAVCHVGTVRDTPGSSPRIITGMPANSLDLQGFERFLFDCATSEKFSSARFAAEMKRLGTTDDLINRAILRVIAVNIARERILLLRDRFKFMDRAPDTGPGRVDTFNPPKVLINFRMDLLPEREWIGTCDLPSLWFQAKREGMWLHWDGNNNSVQERNRSASFGTGATPVTLDRESMKRMEDYIATAAPPAYPYPIDAQLAAEGAPIYAKYCADCHGASGTDFSGAFVGKVTLIDEIGTDRHRLDSYTEDLCANQNLLYAGYSDDRFRNFRKTHGYANSPLDGVWLRAPYLHNGSVPNLRELLEPAEKRSRVFYRGYDVFDRKNVGFVSTVAEEDGKRFFVFDTAVPGNGNQGHEGQAYGTELSDEEKDAIVEFLKTF